jgi:hypothetical protein
MNVAPLKDEEITIGKAVDSPQGDDVTGTIASIESLAPFKGKCPLWTYILAEAARSKADVKIPVKEGLTMTTPQLGPVGGRIVAEVFLGMLFGDNDSFLSANPNWKPTLVEENTTFELRDLVAYALGKTIKAKP